MEAFVSLGIFDMGEFNYLSLPYQQKYLSRVGRLIITLSKRRCTSDLSNTD